MDNPSPTGSRVFSTRPNPPRASYPAANWSRGLQSDVLGVLAHELRTPIQVLIGYLEILRDELADDLNLDRRGIIERMHVNIYELSHTIENLMDFVLHEDDKKPGPEEDIPLSGLIADVTPILEAANQKKRLNVRFETKGAPEIIRAPRRALRSIMVNLALNAIKFTESGTVTISIRQIHADGAAGGAIEIEVEDNGPGIGAAQFERMSQPFAQLSDSSRRRSRGLGLGLSLARRHAATMGGKLELRSHHGQGAKFAVRFPSRGVRGADKHVPRSQTQLPDPPPQVQATSRKHDKHVRR